MLGYEQTLLEEHQKRLGVLEESLPKSSLMVEGVEPPKENPEEVRRKRDRALRTPLQYLVVMCMQPWAMTFCNKLQSFLLKHCSDPASPSWMGDTAELFCLGVEARELCAELCGGCREYLTLTPCRRPTPTRKNGLS